MSATERYRQAMYQRLVSKRDWQWWRFTFGKAVYTDKIVYTAMLWTGRHSLQLSLHRTV